MDTTRPQRTPPKEPSALWVAWLFCSLMAGGAILANERDVLLRGAAALTCFVVVPCGAILWMWRGVYRNHLRPIRPRLTLLQGMALMLLAGIEVGFLVETAQADHNSVFAFGAAILPLVLMAVYISWEPVLQKKPVQRGIKTRAQNW